MAHTSENQCRYIFQVIFLVPTLPRGNVYDSLAVKRKGGCSRGSHGGPWEPARSLG